MRVVPRTFTSICPFSGRTYLQDRPVRELQGVDARSRRDVPDVGEARENRQKLPPFEELDGRKIDPASLAGPRPVEPS